MSRQTDRPLERLALSPTHRPAEFFVRNIKRGDGLINPSYQRGPVWTEDQQISLVYSWMRGIPVPAVTINDRTSTEWRRANPNDSGDYLFAVIDGRQRIEAACKWLTGELLVPATWFLPEHIQRTHDTDDGPYLFYTDLTEVGQRFAERNCLFACQEGRLPTVEAEAAVYLTINGGGTPQTAGDMAKAARVAYRRPAPIGILAKHIRLVQEMNALTNDQNLDFERRWNVREKDLAEALHRAETAAYDSGRITVDHRVDGVVELELSSLHLILTRADGALRGPFFAVLVQDLISDGDYQALTQWAMSNGSLDVAS